MKLAIMQPYFFPYIGYFQLLNAVDRFVFYDDVNFIKGGWINRNRLFLAGAVRYATVPLAGASAYRKIYDTRIQSGEEWIKAMLSSVAQSYAKAPFYRSVRDLLEGVLRGHDGRLASIARNSVIEVARYLGLEKEFVNSSLLYGNEGMKGAERVLDICRIESATEYWNLPGGRELYDVDAFSRAGIDLKFICVSTLPYRQHSIQFVPGLSVLDVLMFNEPEAVREMLEDRHVLGV